MAIFHCIAEYNEWEDETWFHYFLDAPGVRDALQSVLSKGIYTLADPAGYSELKAEYLTNWDDGEYMQKHWFGELTKIDELKSATENQLYKGKIRDFGEELFETAYEAFVRG